MHKFDLDVIAEPWTSPHLLELDKNALVMPLLAWGYQRTHDLWKTRCRQWLDADLCMYNAPDILVWNSDKRYLLELENNGVNIAPSLYFDSFSYDDLEAASKHFCEKRLVIKPSVSATAYKTHIWEKGRIIDDPPNKNIIVQPFLKSIQSYGEISLIYIDRVFSHALRKVPSLGDFRVQPEFGGSQVYCRPSSDLLEAAALAIRKVDGPLLYARVDMVKDNDNNWCLLELELIEPDLFLDADPNGGDSFASAVKRFHIDAGLSEDLQ